MPELPEVETIIRRLRPALVGSVIQSVQVRWARSLATPSQEQFIEWISGQRIDGMERRGKFVMVALERETLLVHLRMSGDLRLESEHLPTQPHDRVIFHLENGSRLVFNDPRKFGRVWLVAEPCTVLGALGPEPFDPQLNPERFHNKLKSHRRLLKPLLLDQTFIAGLGNIYTDEALHLAKLHPKIQSIRLNFFQAEDLLAAIRATLHQGILSNGASIDWVYRGGDFQNHFRVYQRTGLPCPVCETPVERIIVSQRGTHICPVCQRLEF